MTNEILKHEWKQFFDRLSQDRLEWQTRVEVFQDHIGAQVLSDGLPLMGFMLEDKADGQNAIEIMLGEESGAHQTHTIFNLQKVFFKEDENNQSGIIEIEDESGAKTLIHLVQPIAVLVTYEETQIVAQS